MNICMIFVDTYYPKHLLVESPFQFQNEHYGHCELWEVSFSHRYITKSLQKLEIRELHFFLSACIAFYNL